MAAATTLFDGNGRPYKSVGFDGTITFTDYDLLTGGVADTWIDVDGNGVYTPGVDRKSTQTPTALTSSDASYSGVISRTE